MPALPRIEARRAQRELGPGARAAPAGHGARTALRRAARPAPQCAEGGAMTTRRRALVTGGSGDIGGAIAKALAADGFHVHVHANASRARAQEVVDAIAAGGGSADAVAFDLVDGEATRAAVETLLANGPIHALVHNAGIHDDAPLAGMREEQWRRVIDISLHGFFHVVQPLLLPMARARAGRIVAIS